MSKRDWCFISAVVGLLAGHGVAQTPNDQGVAQDHPTPVSRSDGAESDSGTTKQDFAVPVRIIESPEEAERTTANQRQAKEHDAADLDAQQRAAIAAEKSAEAAEWQKDPTKWQVRIGFVAALGLIISLVFTARSLRWARIGNENTIKAIAQEQANAQRSLRAYMGYEGRKIDVIDFRNPNPRRGENEYIGLIFKFTNSGATPARKVVISSRKWSIAEDDPVPSDKPNFEKPGGFDGSFIGPQTGVMGGKIEYDVAELRGIYAQGRLPLVLARVDYIDMFDAKHFTQEFFTIHYLKPPDQWDIKPDTVNTMFVLNLYGNQNDGT